jgi:hypothetical protein
MSETARSIRRPDPPVCGRILTVGRLRKLPQGRQSLSSPRGRGLWFRILGLIHKLTAADRDGPVSKVQY